VPIHNPKSKIQNQAPVLAVIPARFASTRFPGKMLADRTGKPLIQHVYERARAAKSIECVLVATDDERIASAVRRFGGDAIMTRTDHPNGTSRIAEAVQLVTNSAASIQNPKSKIQNLDIIVNVQGDEPDIDPALIDLAVATLRGGDCPVATIASPFAPDEDPANPNIVKVVIDQRGRALYFSRALIPHHREAGALAGASATPLKHVGLYVYRRDFLATYVVLAETPLERAEKLEQLRVLEHGYAIAVAVAAAHHHGIDTPEQYEAFVRRSEAAVTS